MTDDESLVKKDESSLTDRPEGDNNSKLQNEPAAPVLNNHLNSLSPRGKDSQNILWETDARQKKPSTYPTKGTLAVEGGSIVFIQTKRVLDIASYTITGLEIEQPSSVNSYILVGLLSSLLGILLYTLGPLLGGAIFEYVPGVLPISSLLLLTAGIIGILYGVISRRPTLTVRTADTKYIFELKEGDEPEQLIPLLRNG